MLELVPPGLRIDFLGKAKLCITISLLVILFGFVSILLRGGLKQGIDFSGGTLLQLGFSQPAELSTVRAALEPLGLERSIVQHYGSENQVIIRLAQLPGEKQDIGAQVQKALQERMPEQKIEVLRVEIVGPQVSGDLRRQALFAMFYAVLGIVIYLSGRFEAKWLVALALAAVLFVVTYPITLWFPGISPIVLIVVALIVTTVFGLFLQLYYALAALIAVYHDVLVAVGFLSLFDKEFDLQIVAALLTIIGYSLNDTIVIFDRVRENMRGQRREQFAAVVNMSLNQTLSRTILTTGLTLLVVIALFLVGGEVIHDFAFTLLVGMIAGTYSTLFIASPLLVYWHQQTFGREVTQVPRGEARSTRT
jgi:preprotein translocase subunit SecF